MAELEVPEAAAEWHALRRSLTRIAESVDEYAGLPAPVSDYELVVSPKFAFASIFKTEGDYAIDRAKFAEECAAEGVHIRNEFFSTHKRRTIQVVENAKGRVQGYSAIPLSPFAYALNSLGVIPAWGLEQETAAFETLFGLLTPHQWKMYVLTGQFVEASKRANISYIFRRLRPTIALSKNSDPVKPLAALCMHPIGYYQGTWAGAMVPTDDVIAHLMLMRGDEHMFWRRCNQHPMSAPQAGVGF